MVSIISKSTSHETQSTHNMSNHTPKNTTYLQPPLGNQEIHRMIKSGIIQAKLKVSQPNDPYEIEANRVASQIMSMPAPNIASTDEPQIQRKCSSCDMEEDELQISRKPEGTGGIDVSNDFSSQLSNSVGHSLNSSTQSFMESKFGNDFSDVRIHDDSRAAGLASDVNARAFTFGNDIFLNKSESMYDKSLMGHELTHVVQQDSMSSMIQLATDQGRGRAPRRPSHLRGSAGDGFSLAGLERPIGGEGAVVRCPGSGWPCFSTSAWGRHFRVGGRGASCPGSGSLSRSRTDPNST